MEENYENKIATLISKRLTDEISAASFYMEAANYLENLELAEEIKDHAKDEFDHFSRLMNFATNHGIKISYDFDRSVIKKVNPNNQSIINKIQGLEKKAISDYKSMAILAKENEDLESEFFFKELMKEEMEHFDDVAQITGETRKIGEGFIKFKKFSERFL